MRKELQTYWLLKNWGFVPDNCDVGEMRKRSRPTTLFRAKAMPATRR